MANQNKPVTMATEPVKPLPLPSDEIQATGTSAQLVEPKLEDKSDRLKEFQEYKIEVIKDFVGQKKGDKITVSGNVAEALIKKGLVKVIE